MATVEVLMQGSTNWTGDGMAVVTQPKPTGSSKPPFADEACKASIELYWLPLGAGGWFVRLNGRIYEAIHALLECRRPLHLYHSALEVHLPEGRFVIENCWPIPDADSASRGVVVQGPVGSRRIARWRVFRYEVRRWRDGVIADADQAVASPQVLSDDPLRARRLLELVGYLPSPVWGRDELGTGEMWNSNSVISWLLARSGLSANAIGPPAGGRAPGWQAGLVTARASSAATSRPGAARRATTRGGGRRTSHGVWHERSQRRARRSHGRFHLSFPSDEQDRYGALAPSREIQVSLACEPPAKRSRRWAGWLRRPGSLFAVRVRAEKPL